MVGFLHEEDIIEAMTDDIALIVLPSVLYRSGQVLDMEQLTESCAMNGGFRLVSIYVIQSVRLNMHYMTGERISHSGVRISI